MRADLLDVVCCIANPIRWESRIRLYKEFAEHMLDSGVRLTTVECAYGERPHELGGVPHINHVAVRANGSSLIWNKENLLNLGIARLSSDARYIATIDADVKFMRGNWASETIHALQHFDVVQPWSHCYDLGPGGDHLELHQSFCKIFHEGRPIVQGPNAGNSPYQFAHSGYAWAYTRRALDCLGGLIETAALGAADHHQALALIGRVLDSIPGNMTDAYKRPLEVWQQRAERHICRNIGFVSGTIVHAFHGKKRQRFYVDRWDVLTRHKFDPITDMRKNSFGVYELAGNKPELRRDIYRYFTSRNEDTNDAE